MADFVVFALLFCVGVLVFGVLIIINLDLILRDKSKPFDWRDWI